MRKVIYSMSVSLDGYINGPDGGIDWAAPDDELMAFHNEQSRELSAHLCGRGLYEDMLPWEIDGETRSDPRAREFSQIWKAIPKVVFSTTLDKVEGNATLATESVAEEVAAQGWSGGLRVRRRRRPRRRPGRAGPDRRVPAVRQPDSARSRHTLLPRTRRAARPRTRRDADILLSRRLPPLQAVVTPYLAHHMRAIVAQTPSCEPRLDQVDRQGVVKPLGPLERSARWIERALPSRGCRPARCSA